MRIASFRKALVVASFLVAAVHANLAVAHALIGTLGAAATATDLFRVTCYRVTGGPPTFRLATRIQDRAPVAPPQVSVQVFKGNKASNTTDPVDGNPGFSPWAYTNANDGVYYVLVNKTRNGVEQYALDYHCEAKGGVHTGTVDAVYLQNQ